MSGKKRIGIIFGGRSSEHQVSLVSASSVISHLDPDKYEIIAIGITPAGQWMVGNNVLERFKLGEYDVPGLHVLVPDPTIKGMMSCERLANDIEMMNLDVVFPVLHGPYGEDGSIQGILEYSGIPYVGAGVLGSAVCMDKIVQKQLCRANGLLVVDFMWFRGMDWFQHDQKHKFAPLTDQLVNMSQKHMIKTLFDRLDRPVFVKPANMGSSVGITKAHDEKELRDAIELALQYDSMILVEKAVAHVREFEVSVLGNKKPRVSVVGEIVPTNEFYDYNAKYIDGNTRLEIPARLSDKLGEAMQKAALKSFLAARVDGLARIDFLLNDQTQQHYVSEINTLPGFTQISMYPKLWQASGIAYSELLDQIIALAEERHRERKQLKTTFDPKTNWYR
ncbi:D-alanine--D-alanine ligase [candidate division KSB1 bacterium]|nr:D-alanine--D-alanine ligase [candidate division KSB1 bacterium]